MSSNYRFHKKILTCLGIISFLRYSYHAFYWFKVSEILNSVLLIGSLLLIIFKRILAFECLRCSINSCILIPWNLTTSIPILSQYC